MEKFTGRALSAPQLTPHQLIVGSSTDSALASSSICNIHASLGHQDHVTALCHCVLRQHGIKSKRSDDWFWELRKAQEEAPGYVVLANLLIENACISMRHPLLVSEAKRIMCLPEENSGYALLTDVTYDYCKAAYLISTSIHLEYHLQSLQVLVLQSLMGGLSTKHYAEHFNCPFWLTNSTC